jgi:dTDP-4-dehydrorhamnose 3,5-epimerase
MNVCKLDDSDVAVITPRRFGDQRGFFCETWNDALFRHDVANFGFVQDNQSFSAKKGTLRGLHFQRPPYAQGKLVRVTHGSIFDVAVDVRTGSPLFGRPLVITLSAAEGQQLWIPPGFLHGFCTLEDDTEVIYKVTSPYSAAHDAGIIWNDPDLAVPWPVESGIVVLSEKDQRHPRLRELPELFHYNESFV